MADISPQRSSATRAIMAVAHRWPTWLGLAFMVLTALGLRDGREGALVVFLAAFIYLATAVTGRPGTVWPLFWASLAAVFAVRLADVDPWPALVGGAVAVGAVAVASGVLRGPSLAAAQLPAMLLFGGAALAALSLSPQLGGYLVAAALIGHATLDTIVWIKDRVVARSLAEFCAVLDLTLGVTILLIA